jgi:NAD(P)-dependent dehydrogenase (short-subunit alcohol dehydrogenase family)
LAGRELAGRVALVTGAGRGIGRAIALELARAGAAVILSARSRGEIEAVASEIAGLGGRAVALPCDVTDAAAVLALYEASVAAFGAPAILVNNAGAASSHKFEGHPDSLWDRMLAVNLTGPYLLCKACAPAMLEAGWGRVINIGSIASLTGARYIAAYSAAKHGLLGLTRALAAEWAQRGVTANLIAPGYVDTPMTDASIANVVERTGRDADAARAIFEAMSPQRRLVDPAEIAALVRLLASDAGASINGAVLPVDGGASAFASSG